MVVIFQVYILIDWQRIQSVLRFKNEYFSSYKSLSIADNITSFVRSVD